MDGEAHGETAARDAAVDFIADLGFQDFEVARQIDGDFGLLAVDRADLDGDFEAALGGFAAAIAGHGFHGRCLLSPLVIWTFFIIDASTFVISFTPIVSNSRRKQQ